MAVQQQVGRNVRWSLRPYVQTACGPATKFDPIQLQLAEWMESGPGASRAIVDVVPGYLASYLADAGAAGRSWGRQVGIAIGVLLGLLVSIVVLVAW
jgi:hypothetical protein